jgi:DNA repair exonuclease SbcCD nuclease subunit
MRMAITADLHLNNSVYGVTDKDTGLPIRTVDAFKAFEFFVDKAIEMKVDRVVVVGDIFDNHAPSNSIHFLFNKQVQKLGRAGIQSVMLVGNHDSCESHHAVLPLKGWSKIIKVVDEPVVEKRDDYTCIYVPHTPSVQKGDETFPALVRTVSPDSSELSHPRIFFGHFAVTGALMNDYKESSGRSDVSVGDILSTGADVAFLGHFHKFQKIDAPIPIYYVGSLERHDMTDSSEDRAFMVYDTVTSEIDRIPYTGLRPMRKINTASYAEAVADIAAEDSWLGSIVRMDFSGGKLEYAEIKSRFGDIRKEFKARGGLHIYMKDVKYSDDGNQVDQVETVDQLDIFAMIGKAIEDDVPDRDTRSEYMTMFDNLKKEAISI